MSFLVIPKSPKVGKKVEKIGLGSFKYYYMHPQDAVTFYFPNKVY